MRTKTAEQLRDIEQVQRLLRDARYRLMDAGEPALANRVAGLIQEAEIEYRRAQSGVVHA